MSTFAERLKGKLEPWDTPDFEILQQVIARMFEPALEIGEDVGTDGEPGFIAGYGKLLDPSECPADNLAFLGLFVGVEIPVGTPEAEARAIVKAESGQNRATLKAIESAVTRSLKGKEPFFIIVERRGAEGEEDAYQMVIGVKPTELPSLATLEANVNGVKPVIRINFVVSEGYTWDEAIHTGEEDTMTWNESFYRRM